MVGLMSDKGSHGREERTIQEPTSNESAHERRQQEHHESRGCPEKTVETGRRRTKVKDHPTQSMPRNIGCHALPRLRR